MSTHQFTHVHISGMWEETGVPGENPRRCGERVHVPQTVALARNQVFSHQNNVEQSDLIQVAAVPCFPLYVHIYNKV